jgi:Sulfotransferase family
MDTDAAARARAGWHTNAGPVPGGPAGGGAPVIVLSYRHSGAAVLHQALGEDTDMARTSGSGILPLCQAIAATWRTVEGTAGPGISPMAAAAVRAQVTALMTVILSTSGKARWCELATSAADGADAFLQVWPGTRFVCVHRSCPDVIYSSSEGHPWHIPATEFGLFPGMYPGNRAAALAAYWAAQTQRLLEFQAAHAPSCLPVRYEDFGHDRAGTLDAIRDFIGLPHASPGTWDRPGRPAMAPAGPGETGRRAPPLAGDIPAPLAERVNQLLGRLGYPALRT